MDKIPIDTIEDVLVKAKVRFDSVLSAAKESIRDKTDFDFDFFIGYRHNQFMFCTNGLHQVPLTNVLNHIVKEGKITYSEFKNLVTYL